MLGRFAPCARSAALLRSAPFATNPPLGYQSRKSMEGEPVGDRACLENRAHPENGCGDRDLRLPPPRADRAALSLITYGCSSAEERRRETDGEAGSNPETHVSQPDPLARGIFSWRAFRVGPGAALKADGTSGCGFDSLALLHLVYLSINVPYIHGR
jgi:hypothetical protein